MWFHKLSVYDCGEGVTPFFNNYSGIDKLRHTIESTKCDCGDPIHEKKFIIQKGIQNILLYNDRKFDLRDLPIMQTLNHMPSQGAFFTVFRHILGFQ